MKTLISAIALLVVSNIAAMAADQTLKFKLVSFYMGEKDGESHFSGVTVAPNGTIGTKDFFDVNRAKMARQPGIARILFPRWIPRGELFHREHGNEYRRPYCRQIPDRFRDRRLSGRDRRRLN